MCSLRGVSRHLDGEVAQSSVGRGLEREFRFRIAVLDYGVDGIDGLAGGPVGELERDVLVEVLTPLYEFDPPFPAVTPTVIVPSEAL